MKIFRHDGDNYYGPDPEYLYHESVTELPPGDLHSWGTGMFPTKQFDLAKEATAATATLTLGQNVDLGDSSTLDETSFNIKRNGIVYKVQFGTAQGTGVYTNNCYYVNTASSSTDTIQEAFNSIKNSYLLDDFIEDITISGKQINFSFKLTEKTTTITADGNTSIERVLDGSTGNGISIYCEGNTLEAIDTSINAPVFSSTATKTLRIFGNALAGDSLVSDPAELPAYIDNLKYNSLNISPGFSVKFNNIPGLDTISTVGELRQKIADAINDPANNTKGTFEAIYDTTSGAIEITAKNLATDKATQVYLYENNTTIDRQQHSTIEIPLTVTSVPPANAESKAVHTIHIPQLKNDKIYAINLNGNKCVLYPKGAFPGYSAYASNGSSYATTDMNAQITSLIKSVYNKDYDISTDADGNLVLTSKELNNTRGLNIDTSYTDTLNVYKNSSYGLNISDSGYFIQDYTASINYKDTLGDPPDFNKLNGKGFLLNNTYYQFVNPDENPTLYNNKTKPISIKSISSYADLTKEIAQATKSLVTEEPANSGILVMRVSRNANSTVNNLFSDGGPSGTFTNSAVSSGGTAYKNPQAEIDFSKYDMDNLDELYGTGFRLTCATCPGEFVNVVFCHDKSELNYPASFEYTDANGNTNTIHNYMVELKDVTHGSQIAANIADQLKNDLDHFTEVKVSDSNPSVLIAQDKRSLDQSGRGQVLAGVYTNFLYNVLPEKLPNLGDKVGGGRKDTDAYYAYCMIYAGDTREKPYIPVHLPHFSVENLKLEYPKEPWDSYEEITDVMNRSRNAAEVVSMARSKIGADQNRLEHAFDYAANAEDQIAAANSRIEDTDMAEAVTTQAKLTILSNTQEAMLSQIVDLPERILPLLQQ